MQEPKTYRCIGLMSGTSLDGTDLACCRFINREGGWEYEIEHATTVPYPNSWVNKLRSLFTASAMDFSKANADLGIYYAGLINDFISENHISQVDCIGSHGHTIFHQPANHFTTQIGSGAHIASLTGLQTVCDFRQADVALGGQGAPLVPIGDMVLFHQYDYCLNIGGFANISFQSGGQRIAFDICPANFVLNAIYRDSLSKQGLQKETDLGYDKDGMLARRGAINQDLLNELQSITYYSEKPPKSLGEEWVKEHFFPVLAQYKIKEADLLASCCEHIALQIASATNAGPNDKMLMSGGGTLNAYLIERIRYYFKGEIKIPDLLTIHYKEAIIFAFLGLLRILQKVNTLSSVTGSGINTSGGCIYQPVIKI